MLRIIRRRLLGDVKAGVAAILHCGYGQHEIQILDITAGKISSRVNIAEAFYGIVFSPDGARVICNPSVRKIRYS